MSKVYRIGVVGLGHMGQQYMKVLSESERWEVVWVCDRDPGRLEWAEQRWPQARVTRDSGDLISDPAVDVAGIFTLADVRPAILRAALDAGKHVIAEKPLAATLKEEWDLLDRIEVSDQLVTVNLFNRSAWYHREMLDFIASGEIGDLAIVRISHQTPGLMPTEGHSPEGPPFHDCGMHYVDVARWYAGSEYDRWDAQGVRLWGWPDPWWVTVHGCFGNGVVFEITQGFVYGQMAKDMSQNCRLEAIGTLGFVRMSHDFHEVSIEYHGVETTAHKVGSYGGKKLDVLCETFARSLDARRNLGVPAPRDSVIASQVAQDMLDRATANDPPVIGTREEMERILAHRKELRKGNRLSHPSVLV